MYISVNDAAAKFNISKRRVQVLCEQGRIIGANMISGVWLIPDTASKPIDGRRKHISCNKADQIGVVHDIFTVDDVCKELSISKATAKNWIRLGKIVPDVDNQFFSRGYIERFLAELKNPQNKKLKSRRNKKSSTGKILYKDYIHTENNKRLVAELLELNIIEDERDMVAVLANFAIQLYCQSRNKQYSDNNILMHFLSQKHFDDFHILIEDLLGSYSIDSALFERLRPALTKEILFVSGEDSLGFVYISLQDIARRKSRGAYYTPEKVVNELIERLYKNDVNLNARTICDPCCGTGNFLLKLGMMGMDYSNLYGQDIDPISIYITRINIALMTPQMTVTDLYSRFIIGNTYLTTFTQKFDVVLGNPPWGSEFSEDDVITYRKLFQTATGKSVESYDLFVEKALTMLTYNGVMAFVLPEAILSVTAHEAVRRLILDTCSFKFVAYLGNVFSGVQCPSIILGIMPDVAKTVIGCEVSTGNTTFVISKHRTFSDGTLSFNVSDEENRCLSTISGIENAAFLKENAKFALGIVTGNNKEYISAEKRSDNELVLKGSDIQRYRVCASGNYIRFVPESFQQVAPIEIYRAKEKLLYRFISEVPVFTYDNKQTLSLNSCNIVIPEIDGLAIKYVLAILNSSVVAFFISKKFNSVKLLRSHIEQVPIPIVSAKEQDNIIKKVDRIMNSSENISGLYSELDDMVMGLYHLTAQDRKILAAALAGKNLFIDF